MPLFADEVAGAAGAALEPDAEVLGVGAVVGAVEVFGRGSPRSHAARKARENAAATIVVNFIQASMSR